MRRRVWRKQGKIFQPSNRIPTFKSGYQSVSVWTAFSVDVHTPMIRIEGNLNQRKYEQTLQEQLIPFDEMYHGGTGNIIFQQDGCGPHQVWKQKE